MEKFLEEYKRAYGNEKKLRMFWENIIRLGLYQRMRKLAQYQDIILSANNDTQQEEVYSGSYNVKYYTKEDVQEAKAMIKWLLANDK